MITRSILLPLLLLATSIGHASAWGPKGHDIVAHVAWCNMSPAARAAVTDALDGTSMVYWASWMDNIRDLPEYSATVTWHYANVDQGHTYQTMRREPAGDILTAVTKVVAELRDPAICDSLRRVNLKYLIHMVGDMHCPMHAGRLSDRGGNDFPLEWFGEPTSLHSIWDSKLIESVRKWCYTEWQQNIDYHDFATKTLMCAGTVADWFDQTVEVCTALYENAEEGANYSYKYMFENYPVLELQLQRGGYRLAWLLNDIFR